ncbi:phosphatidylcholine-sterol acyltransferase [Anaeramoeba flamelloides]|uniref:Phosphatidylcholine-sterol acyltransferase n=1 Tax=Anaeramoeba flamelloides TaxID=1746091 RepID=A0AAV7Z4N2_9EUKA|nr:phosphatidylcholine-sterol acyltransferase [Anaeramoeba flamelloides]
MLFINKIILFLTLVLLISNHSTNKVTDTRQIKQIKTNKIITDTQPKAPVLLIPGFGGSKIEAKLTDFKSKHWYCHSNKDWFLLWVSLDMFIPVVADCSIEYISLDWDGKNPQSQEGTEFRVVSGVDGVVYLDPTIHFENYYLNLVNKLKKEGYQENLDLFAAPYDFRLSPKNLTLYFNQLINLVEYSSKIDNKKVTLVCHSMGCKMTTFFLTQQTQEWKDTYVEQLIAIAPAIGGAFEGLRSVLFGNNFGDGLMSNKAFQSLALTWPGIYFNIPYDQKLWTAPIAVSNNKNYYSTNQDYHQLFTDLGLPEKSHQILDYVWDDNQNIKNPNVKLQILYGYGSKTHYQVVFKDKKLSDSVEYVDTSGDGVLLEELVLNYCKKWTDNTSVSCQGFKGVTHQDLVSNKDVISSIMNLIKEQ